MTADTDREARLEEIRGWMEKSDCPCGECDVTRFLLSEIDRLREIEEAARDYVGSEAVNERDRLKAKLEGEGD